MTIFGYIILGLLAGLLGGAFGVGGGILMVPVLIILFKQPTLTAIGTSLLVIIPISLSGALRHWQLHNVNPKIALFVAIGGIIGAFIGATLITNVPVIYAKRCLAVILIYSAIRLWFTK